MISFSTLFSIIRGLYRRHLDSLNAMMRKFNFPADLQKRCRMFVINARPFHREAAQHNELDHLFSDRLRGDVAARVHGSWLTKVWYLRNMSHDFVIELSQSLHIEMYAPMEPIDVVLALVVLKTALRLGRIRSFILVPYGAPSSSCGIFRSLTRRLPQRYRMRMWSS